jgi:hypothetical protein
VTIDAYLAELRRRLPPVPLRARFVEEAEAHLRELAAATGDEAEAIRRFGDPVPAMRGELLRRLRPAAAAVAAVATWAYVIPFYLVPENTLPPAQWQETPGQLAWKLSVSTAAFLAAAVLTTVGIAAAGRGWAAPGVVGVVALAVSIGVSLPLSWQWPGADAAIHWGALLPAKLALLALAAAATWASARLGDGLGTIDGWPPPPPRPTSQT